MHTNLNKQPWENDEYLICLLWSFQQQDQGFDSSTFLKSVTKMHFSLNEVTIPYTLHYIFL